MGAHEPARCVGGLADSCPAWRLALDSEAGATALSGQEERVFGGGQRPRAQEDQPATAPLSVLCEDADCHYGDHTYRGGGSCVRCGKRLRCFCGAFVTEAGLDAHLEGCRAAAEGGIVALAADLRERLLALAYALDERNYGAKDTQRAMREAASTIGCLEARLQQAEQTLEKYPQHRAQEALKRAEDAEARLADAQARLQECEKDRDIANRLVAHWRNEAAREAEDRHTRLQELTETVQMHDRQSGTAHRRAEDAEARLDAAQEALRQALTLATVPPKNANWQRADNRIIAILEDALAQ